MPVKAKPTFQEKSSGRDVTLNSPLRFLSLKVKSCFLFWNVLLKFIFVILNMVLH